MEGESRCGVSQITVLAYDHTGSMRVAHEVEPGDLIDWKRNGTRGAYRCEVQRAWRFATGTRLLVMLLSHDGVTIGERPLKRISGRNILAVYKPNGARKDPVRQ